MNIFRDNDNFETRTSRPRYSAPQKTLTFNGNMNSALSEITNSKEVYKLVNEKYNNIAEELIKKCDKGAEYTKKFYKKEGDKLSFRDETMKEKFLKCILYPFVKMPLDIYNGVIGKLCHLVNAKDTSLLGRLNNTSFIKKYREKKETKSALCSLRGLMRGVDKILIKGKEEGKTKEAIQKEALSYVYKTINKMFSDKSGNYNTRDERSLNRLITALLPALFYGFDAMNFALENGQSQEKAKQCGIDRGNQEVLRAFTATYSQYVTVGTFDKFANTNQYGVPILNTITGVFNEIFSRLAQGNSVLPPDFNKTFSPGITNTPAFYKKELNNFSKNDIEKMTKMNRLSPKEEEKAQTDKPKPILTIKNGLIFASTSIIGGFLIQGAKRNIKLNGKFFEEIKNSYTKIKNYTKNVLEKDFEISPSQMNDFTDKVKEAGFEALANDYKKAAKLLGKKGENYLGPKVSKTVKVFNFNLPIEKIISLPLIPLNMLKSIICAPFYGTRKAVDFLSEYIEKKTNKSSFTSIKKFLNSIKTIEKVKKYKPQEDLIEAYKSYLNTKDMNKEDYKAFFNGRVIRSFDDCNNSKIDNTQLGKITKAMTTLLTTYFIVNDFRRQTWEQTHDKNKADKAARETFIQRMYRTVTQLALMDIFNTTFRSQYNASLMGMSVVAASNTVATDCLTRVLSGRPILPTSQEDQAKLRAKRKEGPLGWYYKALERLST